MSDVIQCPQCEKRFRLPEKVPPTFSCTGCGTLMDLSDFGGAQTPPEPVAPAAAPGRGGGAPAGTPRTRTQRRKGAGRRGGSRAAAAPAPSRRGAAAGRGRRGRGRHAHAEEPHGDYHHRAQQRQGNGLLIGSLIGLAVAVILVIVMLNQGDDDKGKGDGTKTTAENGTGAGGNGSGGKGSGGGTGKGATKGGAGVVPTKADGTELTAGDGTGAGSEDGEDGDEGDAPIKKPKRGKSVRLSGLTLQEWPWPDEVDEATRAQVDEAIQNLYRGGRDGNEAEEFLISKGRVVCGRIISEFRRIEESPGFHTRDGASMCGAVDTVLRKIDGVIERKFFEENKIRASSQPSFTMSIAKRWTWWWQHEEWKNNPREPFDSFSESIEDLKAAAKGGTKKKKDGSGFGKRAGG